MGAIGQHADAWTDFWQDQRLDNGCCAHAAEIQRPISHHWQAFARLLTAGSRVLDLGCGTGAAGRALIAAHPLLRVTGVDFAAVPPTGVPRLEILPGTPMESLPFGNASFDAAVSQFGFEYASVEDASREVARVLRPGAPLSFLVHHAEARIATDGRTHRRVLEAICGSQLEAAFMSGNAEAFDRQLALIRSQYPHERIVEEAARGLRRHIELAPAQRRQLWQAVRAALAPELVMQAGLEAAAVSPGRIDGWLRPLAEAFELKAPVALTMAGPGPLCWRIEGVRRRG